MFKLNNLRSPAGSNTKPLRKGKGIGSKMGKTAGKGHKGQNARAGGVVGQVFEGGQVPLSRRSPKVGFNSPLKPLKVKVNVSELGVFSGKDLSLLDLVPSIKSSASRVQVCLMGFRLPKAFPKSLQVHRIAPKTKELLETKGVRVEVLEYRDGARSTRPIKR